MAMDLCVCDGRGAVELVQVGRLLRVTCVRCHNEVDVIADAARVELRAGLMTASRLTWRIRDSKKDWRYLSVPRVVSSLVRLRSQGAVKSRERGHDTMIWELA